MAEIDAYLTEVLDKRGSDLHFIAGDPPRIRLYGDLIAAAARHAWRRSSSSRPSTRSCPSRRSTASRPRTAPTSPTRSPSSGRFRVNVMRQLNGMGAVFRAIPSKALTMDELKLPESVRQMCARQQWADPGDRQDRLGQVHHARGDDRRHQHAA